MAAPTAVQNPSSESKAARKKKSKSERTESPAPASTLTPEKAASVAAGEGAQDESSENPYIRELQKNIRNFNKKITNSSKIEGLLAANKDKSLDELVKSKVINADQKAAYLNIPNLQKQIAQFEEQLAQFKKVDQDFRTRLASEKADLEKSLTEKLQKEKRDAVAEAEKKAEAEVKKGLHDGFLVLSQFLRLAAAKRAEEPNSEADENLALEGVLLHVYSGDENAVDTMLKLVNGSEDTTTSVSGTSLQTTYAKVKSLAVAHAAPLFQTEAAPQQTEIPVESTEVPQTDPTIAHAGMTEIDTAVDTPLTNGHTESPINGVTINADVGDSAANLAGETQWDTGNNNDLSMSQEWVDVKVPRDPAETETGLNATPAAASNTQSWADDQPDTPTETPAAPDSNDGFHQVQGRHRGRGDRDDRPRGRGGYRGRGGFRGDGRGRGRGRGGMAVRGGRREDSNQ